MIDALNQETPTFDHIDLLTPALEAALKAEDGQAWQMLAVSLDLRAKATIAPNVDVHDDYVAASLDMAMRAYQRAYDAIEQLGN